MDLLKYLCTEKKLLLFDGNTSIINDYIKEISAVIFHEPLDKNQLFEKYYPLIYCDVVLIIYKNPIASDVLRLCQLMSGNLTSVLYKIKQYNIEFQTKLVDNLSKIAQKLVDEELSKDTETVVNFERNLSPFFNFIYYSFKEKSMAKPCLDLAYTCLCIKSDYECLNFSAKLLYKRTFYTFKDSNDTVINIFKQLIKLSFLILVENVAEKTKAIGECVSSMISHVQPNSQLVKLIHLLVFKELILKIISENHENSSFFGAIKKFFEAFLFNNFSMKSEDLLQLKEVFKLSVEEKILKSLHSDLNSFSYTRNLFYLYFFRGIATSCETRHDILATIEPEIILMLNRLDKIDNFYDQFYN